jgi:hypothetical protein
VTDGKGQREDFERIVRGYSERSTQLKKVRTTGVRLLLLLAVKSDRSQKRKASFDISGGKMDASGRC